MDGNDATFWRNLSSDGMYPWMIVDLGEGAVFDSVYLKLYVRQAMSHFKLEYSNDKINWQPLAEETENLLDGTEFTLNVKDEIGEDYVQARYLRFTHELGASGNVNGLYYLKAFEADVEVESVTIDRGDFSLVKDTALQLHAEVGPNFLDQTVIWRSSDDSVVTVDENGKVTAIGEGTATITAASYE